MVPRYVEDEWEGLPALKAMVILGHFFDRVRPYTEHPAKGMSLILISLRTSGGHEKHEILGEFRSSLQKKMSVRINNNIQFILTDCLAAKFVQLNLSKPYSSQ
ncbi:hypothetical protein M5689_020945 [Euphorbia peplus]|nr:hypothetical protein M5689_020945 [Euphorbia peplus]